MNNKNTAWSPLHPACLGEIRELFDKTYPKEEYGDLAEKISLYWTDMLHRVWAEKSPDLKEQDKQHDPSDPLDRIEQKTVVITYADSIRKQGEPSLNTLDKFLKKYFPSIQGMHILPACAAAEGRFNDGYFSQIQRNRIHAPFGSNDLFADLMHRYFSMTDFVLNHVDMDNPKFQSYLAGDDQAGNNFFVFTEDEYQRRLQAGDFDHVFRPRPFPLFSIYRRKPSSSEFAQMSREQQAAVMQGKIKTGTGHELPGPAIDLLYMFHKLKNDQMLLDGDYALVLRFIDFLSEKGIQTDTIFTESETQEVKHIPYVLRQDLETPADVLRAIGFEAETAEAAAHCFTLHETEIFGERIRALTTFSHVQADLNTATYEGLRMLADDFSWYLSMDLNMLRLDAANYAFKRWGTSCFGLPEVTNLMKILYLSMESVSPRIVANLEVNDSLTTVLTQMADKEAPPPMMYDFHLASLLPAVFLRQDPEILTRIGVKIAEFDVPETSIRFSLAESHDGKSVRGSMDLLSLSERQDLADLVEKQGGQIKYKSVPKRKYPETEFISFCGEIGTDAGDLRTRLFQEKAEHGYLVLRDEIKDRDQLEAENPEFQTAEGKAVKFFLRKLFEGREPYELCTTTRDAQPVLSDTDLEIRRYLSFHTLAFALMGRNVKSVYFNDLLALPNDYARLNESGELRDLKRTKSRLAEIEKELENPGSFTAQIVRGMNDLIALTDEDPALSFRGTEASVLLPEQKAPVAVIYNRYDNRQTLVIVNLSEKSAEARISLQNTGFKGETVLQDQINTGTFTIDEQEMLRVSLEPFQRLWLRESPL